MMKPERRITEAYLDLARKQYEPLIHQLASWISVDKIHAEELKVQAVEELVKCMICYKHIGSFITFFYGRLRDIFRHRRDAEINARRIQIIPIELMDSVVSCDHDIDTTIAAQECLGYLSDEELEIITDIYFDERTMKEISNSRRIGISTIYSIRDKAINRMRQKCKVELG